MTAGVRAGAPRTAPTTPSGSQDSTHGTFPLTDRCTILDLNPVCRCFSGWIEFSGSSLVFCFKGKARLLYFYRTYTQKPNVLCMIESSNILKDFNFDVYLQDGSRHGGVESLRAIQREGEAGLLPSNKEEEEKIPNGNLQSTFLFSLTLSALFMCCHIEHICKEV